MTVNAPELLSTLKAEAARQMASYPQYNGHFDKYILVRIDRDIRTKLGLAFKADEYVIMAPDRFPSLSNYVPVWSMLNACDTAIPRRAIQNIVS